MFITTEVDFDKVRNRIRRNIHCVENYKVSGVKMNVQLVILMHTFSVNRQNGNAELTCWTYNEAENKHDWTKRTGAGKVINRLYCWYSQQW